MLDLAAVQEQLHAVHTANLRLAEIDCPECDHHALIVVQFESPDSVTCPKCGTVLDLLNGDEIQAEVDARNVDASNKPAADQMWNCLMCGIQQPAWAGDCLTCPDDHDKGADHD